MKIARTRRSPDRSPEARVTLYSAHVTAAMLPASGKRIVTSYSEERSEVVYCEACYLAEVY